MGQGSPAPSNAVKCPTPDSPRARAPGDARGGTIDPASRAPATGDGTEASKLWYEKLWEEHQRNTDATVKFFEEEQNMIENYSLLSGVPIKDINQLETKVLLMVDYRILPETAQVDQMLRGDIDALFGERSAGD